jgi:hypothetical protein
MVRDKGCRKGRGDGIRKKIKKGKWRRGKEGSTPRFLQHPQFDLSRKKPGPQVFR